MSEIGRHCRNEGLLRNEVKKVGQLDAVKLLPKDVSNGEAIGVVTTVTEGVADVDVVVGVEELSACLSTS